VSNVRYRAFVAVAHHGSLSAAARALGVSQPTISTQIATLERQSQIELFHRRGYRMTLTGAGARLLPMAQKIMALESEAEFFLRDSGRLHQGELKIGAVGPFHVIEMVAAYRARHPGMQLSIRMGNSQQVLADLERYATDVAVLAGLYDRPELLAREYARHAIILFAHVAHPFARRSEIALSELQGQPLLLREHGSTTRTALESVLQSAGVQPRTDLEIGSREAIREAVARGLGLGAVSEAEFIPDPRFRPLRIAGDPASTTTYVYCMRERGDSLLVRSCVDSCCLRGRGPVNTKSGFALAGFGGGWHARLRSKGSSVEPRATPPTAPHPGRGPRCGAPHPHGLHGGGGGCQAASLRVARLRGRLRRCTRLQGTRLAAHVRLAYGPATGQRDPRISVNRP
jgi:aminoethylphosphonate catabolism LysR family transcriptional regulator